MILRNFRNYIEFVEILGEEKVGILKHGDFLLREQCGEQYIYSLVTKRAKTGFPVIFHAAPYKTEADEIGYVFELDEGESAIRYRTTCNLCEVLTLADKLYGLRGILDAEETIKNDPKIVKVTYRHIDKEQN